jgi:hypothetical protein
MSVPPSLSWFDANQRYLTLSLKRLRFLLESRRQADTPPPTVQDASELEELAASMHAPPALVTLCNIFGLSKFERDVLLLCAGLELDSQFAALLDRQAAPTFSLALSLLPEAHWSALTPAAPLRHWRLVELGPGTGLTQSPLCIDEAILHHLAGAGYMDDRLAGYIEPLPPAGELVLSQQKTAEQIALAWSRAQKDFPLPVIQLFGMDAPARQQVGVAASDLLGLSLNAMRANSIPAGPVEAEALQRLWEREAILGGRALLLDCEDMEMVNAQRWIENAGFPLLLSSRERLAVGRRQALGFEIRRPTQVEQRELWRHALGPAALQLNGRLDAVVAHFDLDAHSIASITSGVLQTEPAELGTALWQACRAQSHSRLGELAQRIPPLAVWEDLVLPKAQVQTLREVAVHVRQRMQVYENWGFAAKSARGLGISALFSGASGTGKTMAAEVLANELQLDLYRIDLSQVVSKYIGETEKNLRRVFDAAEQGGAILLFDEADALFGKRSEVKDSHDRYANVEISYLLQRMEAYRGLAILTTNLKDAIDTAFMRRIRFVVAFPFPDAAQRAEIWRRVFPSQTPTEGLDVERLSRLSLAGGNIHNIAMYAAFLAADAHQPVEMSHLLHAARAEYSKLEKPLSEAEIGGWE